MLSEHLTQNLFSCIVLSFITWIKEVSNAKFTGLQIRIASQVAIEIKGNINVNTGTVTNAFGVEPTAVGNFA